MGIFIDMAAVLAPEDRVNGAINELGSDAGCYSVQPDRTLVLYQEATGDFERIKDLSRKLGVAAFACHIHDDDLWLYEFYLSGELVDKFNTIPSYWEELPPDEEAKWRGDADLLTRHWPGLSADSIRRYLVHHSDDDWSAKAYLDDEFSCGDCWQVTDFLRKIGTPYPPDNDASE